MRQVRDRLAKAQVHDCMSSRHHLTDRLLSAAGWAGLFAVALPMAGVAIVLTMQPALSLHRLFSDHRSRSDEMSSNVRS
jgi:hypothetical protein